MQDRLAGIIARPDGRTVHKCLLGAEAIRASTCTGGRAIDVPESAYGVNDLTAFGRARTAIESDHRRRSVALAAASSAGAWAAEARH
jgi:hypothetical protein